MYNDMYKNKMEKTLVALRLYNSHMIFPDVSIQNIVTSHLGIQSQSENSAALAIGLRTKGLTLKEFNKSAEILRLIRTWGVRTTLHIYDYDDWETILSHLSMDDNWYRKKMRKENRDIEELVDRAIKIIEKYDYFDKRNLIEDGLDSQDLGSWGDLLIELSLRGYIFQSIGWNGACKKYGNTKNVFGQYFDIFNPTDEMKKELFLRYLYTYGPATVEDFAHWRGTTIHDAKKYFELAQSNIETIYILNKAYLVKKGFSIENNMMRKIKQRMSCIIVPKFDPLLLAYSDKSWLISKENEHRIWGKAGHVFGIIIQHSEVVATWKYILKNNYIDFEISPFSLNFSLSLMDEEFKKVENFFEKERGNIYLK